MRISVRKGFGFGLTSGIITTLGLILGLNSSTHSPKIILGGILVIAVADALSDALGMHISEEAEQKHTQKEIWEATIATFITKFIIASIFIIPFLLLSLSTAIIFSIVWGLSLISIFSFYIAKKQNMNPWGVVLEHLIISIFVIMATHLIGSWVSNF